MIGKRKRDVTVVPRTAETETDNRNKSADDKRDVFRQYFESTFEPLPDLQISTPSPLEDEDEDHSEESDYATESDWDGIAEDTTPSDTVQVIEHQASIQLEDDTPDKRAVKTFMTSKPPSTSTSSSTQSSAQRKPDPLPSTTDLLNLKHDLALQRLLSESHLLRPHSTSTSRAPDPVVSRHRTIDLRLQSLGAKTALFAQPNIPIRHRQGMLAKSAGREEKRRREARENGVVLEKPRQRSGDGGVGGMGKKKRERGVGGPSIGRFEGGTLRIRARDVREIEGGRGRGRRRGGGTRGKR